MQELDVLLYSPIIDVIYAEDDGDTRDTADMSPPLFENADFGP